MPARSLSPQECWDRLLEARPLNSEDIARLQQEQRDAGALLGGDRLLANTLRPLLLDAAQLERDRAMAQAVVTALVSASRRLEQDPVLAQRYCGDWMTQFGEFLRIDPGYRQRSVFARLDVLPTPEGPKVIEYNSTPAGFFVDQLSGLFLRLAGQIGFDRDWQLSPLLVFPRLRDAIIHTYQDWGGTGEPLVILAVPRELGSYVSGIRTIIDILTALGGLRVRYADPGELEFTGGALRHQGEPVGVLIRFFVLDMIPRLGDRLQGVFAAVRAGAVCMIAAFRNTLLSHKALFAMLTDPELDLELPATVSEQVRACVPWTRLLVEGWTTDPAGQRIDLLPWALAEREQLVCKPALGYGGAGVVLGWTVTEAQWRESLEQAARRGGSLLQQRVTLIPQRHPLLAEGTPGAELYADQNIFIADGELAGYLTRLSPTLITNISQGAGIVPSFLATPRSQQVSGD